MQNNPNPYLKYSSVAIEMILIILLGVWAGRELDIYFANKTPWYTLFLSLSSVIGSIYRVIKRLI